MCVHCLVPDCKTGKVVTTGVSIRIKYSYKNKGQPSMNYLNIEKCVFQKTIGLKNKLLTFIITTYIILVDKMSFAFILMTCCISVQKGLDLLIPPVNVDAAVWF